jgi:hypothetical protein
MQDLLLNLEVKHRADYAWFGIKWKIYQLDSKSTFQNSYLEEDVYCLHQNSIKMLYTAHF